MEASQGRLAELLVDSKRAAELLRISPRKLWDLTFKELPGIPHVRFGRSVRYSVDDLKVWIETQRKGV